MVDESLRNELRQLVKKAFDNAQNVHEEAIKNERNPAAITGYLSVAMSYLGSARTIIILKGVEGQELRTFISSFEIFADEVMTNLSTDDGRQWTNSEFNLLGILYSSVASLLGIEE